MVFLLLLKMKTCCGCWRYVLKMNNVFFSNLKACSGTKVNTGQKRFEDEVIR